MTDVSDTYTSMLNLKSFSLLTKNCDYLGEGNCHIIISIKDEGLVLRLKKVDNCLENDQPVDKIYEFEKLSNELLFHDVVMKYLIGERFVYPLSIVSLNESHVSNFISKFHSKRPLYRQYKKVCCNFGFLSPDYTSDKLINYSKKPTLCVEIKAKQGWIPDYLKKYKKCFYCMNQHLKLKKSAIRNISEYCPLDLFSGNISRMYVALSKLLENPQNNIKVTISGNTVYSENDNPPKIIDALLNYFHSYEIDVGNPLDLFFKIIIKTLLWSEEETAPFDNDGENFIIDNSPNVKSNCHDTSSNLPMSCVLKNILQLQLLEKDVTFDSVKNPDFEYVDNLISLFKNVKNSLNFTRTDKLNSLEKYMLASIAKDCSIMISMKPVQKFSKISGKEIFIEEKNHRFIVNIGVIDVGPKPCSKINYHKKRNLDVLENFLNS